MKKQRHIQTTRTLLSRFRYWGRKNYAAFASMGREFQIGHLHTNVVDVALRKQNAAQTIPYHTFMTLQEIKDQVRQMSGELQMVCTILSLQDASRSLRPPSR